MAFRPRLLLMLLLICLAAPIVVTGCGGGSSKDKGEQEAGSGDNGGGEEADQEGSSALDKIPDSDRTAFLQLATSIGTLRARAAPVAVGSSATLGPAAPIVRARAQVSALHPADPNLVATRARLIPALSVFAHAPLAGAGATRAARAAIARADRIERGLQRYSRSQPAIGGVIPD
jgi:hypothetical protein